MKNYPSNITLKATKQLTDAERNVLFNLWNEEYPKSIAYSKRKELETYLSGLGDVNHALVIQNDQIIGWFWDFIRDEKRNFAMILNRNFQGQGIGTQCLKAAKKRHNELFGWVVDTNEFCRSDGSFYPSPLAFYEKNGFEIQHNNRFTSEKLSTVRISWKRI